jgi:hypothetical protein
MTLEQLITMLKSRIEFLGRLRETAAQQGDVTRVNELDAEKSETENTLTKLQTLV